ncbi:MAG: histidinol-phosphatase [Campylobacteraceae bacterium]
MLVDLHNHTTLCNHATGQMREYVLKAIELGCKYYGFSEHAPMNFDEKYRMKFSEIPFYEKSILELKDEFKEKIEIFLAYEVDFLEGLIDDRVMSRKVDYFIGSVHFLGNWGFDNPEFIGEYKDKNIDDIWTKYFEAIESLAKSGLFDIVGHLDLLKVFKFLPTKDIRVLAKDAINAIKKANLVVELNVAGLRKPIEEIYPSPLLLEMIKEKDISITFSSDAHSVDQVGYKNEELQRLAKSFKYDKVAIFRQRDRELIKF